MGGWPTENTYSVTILSKINMYYNPKAIYLDHLFIAFNFLEKGQMKKIYLDYLFTINSWQFKSNSFLPIVWLVSSQNHIMKQNHALPFSQFHHFTSANRCMIRPKFTWYFLHGYCWLDETLYLIYTAPRIKEISEIIVLERRRCLGAIWEKVRIEWDEGDLSGFGRIGSKRRRKEARRLSGVIWEWGF